MTIKKTFEELNELDGIVGNMFQDDENLANSKFGYGYKKFYKKNLKKVFEDYREVITDMYIDNALVDDKTKALITTEKGRGFAFDKAGIKQVIKEEKKILNEWNKKEFDIEPYIMAPENLPELSEIETEALKGVLTE